MDVIPHSKRAAAPLSRTGLEPLCKSLTGVLTQSVSLAPASEMPGGTGTSGGSFCLDDSSSPKCVPQVAESCTLAVHGAVKRDGRWLPVVSAALSADGAFAIARTVPNQAIGRHPDELRGALGYTPAQRRLPWKTWAWSGLCLPVQVQLALRRTGLSRYGRPGHCVGTSTETVLCLVTNPARFTQHGHQ